MNTSIKIRYKMRIKQNRYVTVDDLCGRFYSPLVSTRQRCRRFTIISTFAATASVLLLSVFSDIFIWPVKAFVNVRPFSIQNKAIFGLRATGTITTKDVLPSSSSLSSSSSEENSNSLSTTSYGSFDRQEFEMQVGRAMDTLRDDYPQILIKDPDYSIYSEDLELIDPTGVHLHGVKNYKNAIRLVHAMVGIFYCPERSVLTFRMCFDKARQNIRIHWNARIIPIAIFGGTKSTLHVDGISIYELDRMSGNITQHRLERLVMNDDYITPEQGIFAALRRHAIKSQAADGIPVLSDSRTHIVDSDIPNQVVPFKSNTIFPWQQSILFRNTDGNREHDLLSLGRSSFITGSSSHLRLNSISSSSSHPESDNLAQSNSHQQHQQHHVNGLDVDQTSSAAAAANSNFDSTSSTHLETGTLTSEALEKKNSLRKKFGLKPLTMKEFVELEGKVAELDIQQKKKAAAAAVELERAKQQKENNGGFLNKLFGDVMKDTCESNYDCEHPEVCCDFGFKKMCCTSGMRVFDGPPKSRYGQLARVPVPVTNPNPYPPNDPRRKDVY